MNIKRILYLALAVLCLGGAIAYYMWNKPHAKVEDTKGLAITAADLCAAFTADEAAATKKYTAQVLDVSGTVTEVKKNQDGNAAVTLQGNDMMSVQCTMRDKDATVALNKQVVIKGRFASVDMFGPTLTDCVMKE